MEIHSSVCVCVLMLIPLVLASQWDDRGDDSHRGTNQTPRSGKWQAYPIAAHVSRGCRHIHGSVGHAPSLQQDFGIPDRSAAEQKIKLRDCANVSTTVKL